jgi:hypothetical protein
MLVYWASVKYFLSPVKSYIGGLREIVFSLMICKILQPSVQKIYAFLEIIHQLET